MSRTSAPSSTFPQPARLAGLDILRGVASVAVCLFHWEHIAFQTPNDAQVFRFGLLGVELFFIVSGFVILMVAERTTSVQNFLHARIIRLYPAYLLSVALTAIYVLSTGKYDVATVLINATMLQSFMDVPNIANPYWTLAFEISFYAAMSIVLRFDLLRRIEWLAFAWLVVAACYRFMLPGWMSFDPQRPLVQASYIVVAPQFAPFFVLGMMAFRAYRNQLGKPGLVAIAAALLLTLQGRGDFAQISGHVYAGLACVFTGALMVAVRVNPLRLIASTFGWIGAISYPLYLFHCTVANLCVYVLHDAVHTSIAVFVSIPISLVLSVLVHRWIERPMALSLNPRTASNLWAMPASI